MTRRRLSAIVAVLMFASLTLLGSSVVSAHFGHGRHGLGARLNGAQEVPPADVDGRGSASFKIRSADGQLCYRISFSRIATPTVAHIHEAPKGVSGPVVVPLFDASTADANFLDKLEAGKAVGCVTVEATLLQAIKDDPSAYYVNVHNARYPNGAIRGQLREGFRFGRGKHH